MAMTKTIAIRTLWGPALLPLGHLTQANTAMQLYVNILELTSSARTQVLSSFATGIPSFSKIAIGKPLSTRGGVGQGA